MTGGIALVFLQGVRGQTPQTFEVASIRPTNLTGPAASVSFHVYGGRVEITGATLKTLIREAWRVQSEQITGGPAWLYSDRYDIVAKTGVSGNMQPDQMQALLQNLLADRFGLRIHRESRQMTVAVLVTEKSGPKMKVHEGEPGPPAMHTSEGPDKARLTGSGVGMKQFAAYVGSQLNRVVLDMTGLSDIYDFSFEWAPESAESAGPSIYAALREQLGLRLQSQKGSVEMLVVDSAEKASEN